MCAGERKTKTASESNSSKSQQEDSLTASAVGFSTTRIQLRVCEFRPPVEDIGPIRGGPVTWRSGSYDAPPPLHILNPTPQKNCGHTLHLYRRWSSFSCRSKWGSAWRTNASIFRRAQWTCSSFGHWHWGRNTGGRSRSVFNRFRAMFCKSSRAPCIRPCIGWSGEAGSKPNGVRRITTAEPNTTSSRLPAKNSLL